MSKTAGIISRAKLAWHILRGRPGAYQVRYADGKLTWSPPGLFVECGFHGVFFVQRGGPVRVRLDGMKCGYHALTLVPDDEGNYRCPMDNAVELRVRQHDE